MLIIIILLIFFHPNSNCLCNNGESYVISTQKMGFFGHFNLSSGMFAVQLYGVHEYEIVENAKVLEVKNGPYFGPEKDRTE